jgi:hypothetical protein
MANALLLPVTLTASPRGPSGSDAHEPPAWASSQAAQFPDTLDLFAGDT